LLGGQWNVPLLGGQWNVKEKPFSSFSTFPPTNVLKPSNFPLTLKFYFTMVLGCYSCLSFFFLRSIIYECASRCTKSFTPSLSIKFCLKI
jgi:hypothetical protein